MTEVGNWWTFTVIPIVARSTLMIPACAPQTFDRHV
jgi:hypothetical protein